MKIITNKTDILPESKFNLDSVLFFDIETTGLSRDYSNVYLIGCAHKEGDSFTITQFFAENRNEEEEIVRMFFDHALKFKTLVHFNGNGFDVPYMDHKALEYMIPYRLKDMDNFDILKRARLSKSLLGLQKMNQKVIEEFLHIKRDDEKTGGELIEYYHEYEKTGDDRLEEYLLLHNYDDILGMLKISGITNYADICDGIFEVEGYEESDGAFSINIILDNPVPRPFEHYDKNCLFAAYGKMMQVVIDKYEGEAYYYLDDYQNYYYLPKEDIIVHKDVAKFVDREHKEKAKKNNCFLKKESVYLPYFSHSKAECFCHPMDKRFQLMEIDNAYAFDNEMLKAYALEIIRKST